MPKGRGAFALRVAIDALLALLFLLTMATALVAQAPHEYLGVALVACTAAHIAMHGRWIAALGRGRWTALRVLQTAVLAGLAACLVGQAVSAVVLSKHALAFLPALPGAAWARRVHMLCAYWSFMFAFAHAGLHLRGMTARAGKALQGKAALLWAVRVAIAVAAVFGAVSFVQMGLFAYLSGQVQFAAAAPDVLLSCIRWASVAVLVAVVFHALGTALAASARE